MTIYFTMMLVLIAGITFFHWLQGLFSATISVILAIIAATIAVAYHEKIVLMALRGRFADQAPGIAIIILFAVTYIVLRVIFDKAVPGNVRLPALVDKIGGGVMGVIASVFATGIITIAGHSLPFGPTIAGFARFALDGERNVVIPTGGQMKDGPIVDELHGERFEEKDRTSMLIPVDTMVINTVSHLSDGGALAGDQPFRTIHPDYNDELFNNRLGIQVGAKHTAINNANQELVKSPAGESVFWFGSLPQKDPEFATYRERQIGPNLKPEGDQIIVVVRVTVNIDATDDDRKFRFGLGTVRLVANSKNHFPEGTMEAGTLMNGKPDDYMFMDFGGTGAADEPVDFVFLVDRTDITDDAP